MSEETKVDFLTHWGFQDYLSFGYLYLLLLGVASDSIYYGFVGINIISYSTILDVLLSPVVRLTDNLALPLLIFIMPALGYFYIKLIIHVEKKKREKAIAAGKEQPKPKSTRQFTMQTLWFSFTCLIIFSAFMGYGIGAGYKQSQFLETGQFKLNTSLTFQDGHTEQVRKVGNNSEYVFYIRKGDKTVSVSPIKDTIQSIRELSEAERE